MNNLSRFSDIETAYTCKSVCQNRSQNLFSLGVKKAIELCVGPSLMSLSYHYENMGIEVWGNDIDSRWKLYFPSGKWIMGDAMHIPIEKFDCAVFAPPLSKGCSGSREDSLSINQIFPRYRNFLERNDLPKIVVLVLPGRSLATRADRSQFYSLMTHIKNQFSCVESIEMKGNKNKVTKYVDLYCYN